MVISLADWQFSVDVDATLAYTHKCSLDHCTCPYCQNFYENMDRAEPSLRPVLSKFGVYLHGPCEVMPFEPTLVAACYRITGQIIHSGISRLHINGVSLRPEGADETSFFLWVGPMELPWTQIEDMDEVISPANQPEFMDRMMLRWLKWAEHEDIPS
jgi:hypothetical protein